MIQKGFEMKMFGLGLLAICVCFLAFGCTAIQSYMEKSNNEARAQKMYNRGDYASAAEFYIKAGDYAHAAESYQMSCDHGLGEGRGDLNSCVELGRIYESGKIGALDSNAATELYQKACDANNARGCGHLAVKVGDKTKALVLYTKACTIGYSYEYDIYTYQDCFRVGNMYRDGIGTGKDIAKALQYYKKACNGGARQACIAIEDISLKLSRNESN
jgi:TPR repeat protein